MKLFLLLLDDVQSAGFSGFNGKTGGMLENSEGVVIAVVDNNPYQHWNGYDAQDVDDPDSDEQYGVGAIFTAGLLRNWS